MEIINTIVGTPLGYIMKFCYDVFHNYGLAIIVFTLITKIVMFPISLLVQKNSIKMVKMKPQLNALRYQYIDDKDAFVDAQSALYKKEKYSPIAGVWPLLLQLPIIFGLLDVVYKPLKHLLHLSTTLQNALVSRTALLLNKSIEDLGSTVQLTVVEQMKAHPEYFKDIDGVSSALESVQNLNMGFLGMNLSETPSFLHFSLLWLVPLFAGLSALLMCWIQNRINVLQVEQSKLSQWAMTIFMVLFSGGFACIVPTGVGMYWGFGNLFAIAVMYLVNVIYSPKQYINYDALEKMKKDAIQEREKNKQNKIKAKAYVKQFFENEKTEHMKVVFYAEGSGYYKYLRNIIEALLDTTNITIHYITGASDDPILKNENDRIKSYYVDETRLISLMMKLECDMVVMTTPDLEKYHIKRSRVRDDIEYIYVDHACSSLNLTYRPGAFDAFNTIFAVSRQQAVEVRCIEALRNTKKKRIVECGYGLIDNMIDAYQKSEKIENEKKTILIAPSWQYDNIMDSCLDDLIQSLDGKGYKIVIRPHPQYVRRFPLKIHEILDKYKDRMNENFIIETDFSSNVTVYTADLIISDWSSIAFEFSFTKNRPTLFINTQMKVVNKDYKKIDIKPFDLIVRNQIGISIEKDQCLNADQYVKTLLDTGDNYEKIIQEVKENYFYHLGESGKAGADYIMHRLARLYPSS